MKKNTFKRVLAGSLALLTVTAYTPANVGGLIQVRDNAIVASAANYTITWDDNMAEYITSISDGTTTMTSDFDSYPGRGFIQNAVLTIVTTVPLDSSVFTGKTKASDVDFTQEENKDKYTETVGDNTYTYKMVNTAGVTLKAATREATVSNQVVTNLELADKTQVTITQFTGEVVTNGIDSITNGAFKITNSDSSGTAKFIANGKATFTAAKAFEVYMNRVSGDTQTTTKHEAVYDATNKNFVVTIDHVPTDSSEQLNFYISKATVNYSFTKSDTALTATANGVSTVVASVSAKSQAKVKASTSGSDTWAEDGVNYKYDTAVDLASGGTVPNASKVELTFTNDSTGEITTTATGADGGNRYTLKITRDGRELTSDDYCVAGATALDDAAVPYDSALTSNISKYVPNAEAESPGSSTLSFTKSGKYVVEYTVYTKTTSSNGTVTLSPQKLTYEFTIKNKDLLTAENVSLAATGTNLKDGASIKKVGVVNGVVEFEVTDDWTTDNTITITPTIYATADAAAAGLVSNFKAGATDDSTTTDVNESANGTPKSIVGSTAVSELDAVQQLTLVYNNPDYSANDQAITIQYKLIRAKKAVTITPADTSATGANGFNGGTAAFLTATSDTIDTLEEQVFEAISVNNGDASKVTFEYMKGFGATTGTEELDWHEDGLPTEKGEYSVFILYDGEALSTFNLKITEHALKANPTAKQLSITYGDKAFTSDDLAFVDVDGNVVKDAKVKDAKITYTKAYKLTDKQAQKIAADGTITFATETPVGEGTTENFAANTYAVVTIDGGKYLKGTADEDKVTLANADALLNAGAYVVTVEAESGKTTVGKEGYDLVSESFGMKVAKKAITADMVLIDPQTYTGGTLTVGTNNITVKDSKNNVTIEKADISVAGGTTAASAVGAYNVQLQVKASNPNYTGKVTAKWHIVAKGKTMTALKFDEAKTTIYDNGQIHFEITRPADNQFSNGVDKFGVIIEKAGLLDAPTVNSANIGTGATVDKQAGYYPKTATGSASNGNFTYTNGGGFAAADQFSAAAKALVLGNGFTEGKQGDKQKAETPTKYGANINVTDVETGAWFRPYVTDKAGNVYYGEVIYVNLVQEATDQLNLKMSKFVDTNVKGVKTKDEAKENQSATVLANKTWRNDVQSGYNEKTAQYYVYGSYTLSADSNVKSSAVQGFGVVVDKKGAFAANATVADVKNGLKLGKGFIEGKSGSNKMDIDEYGAMINPQDSLTGVWVRAYVDLGNSLVVYTDPIYIDSVSKIYEKNKPSITYAKDSSKVSITVGGTAYNGGNATVKQVGVVVDKSGSFLNKNANGEYTANWAVNPANASDKTYGQTKANTALLIDKGYLQGKKTVTNVSYTAKVTPTNAIPVVARPYVIYTIYGKDVTVYGDVTGYDITTEKNVSSSTT